MTFAYLEKHPLSGKKNYFGKVWVNFSKILGYFLFQHLVTL